ncbi:hypothetical protein STANM309S_03948 [Streptomyces tanashiensis]
MIPTAIGLVISQLVVKDDNFKDAVARTVGGIVPMIPEGLVLLTSVAFAIGVIRLQPPKKQYPFVQNCRRSRASPGSTWSAWTRRARSPRAAWTSPGLPPERRRRDVRTQGAGRPRQVRPAQRLPLAIIDAYPDTVEWRCTESLPFSSARKYSGASYSEGDGENSTWLLGAPTACSSRPATPTLPEIDHLNEQGLRVLLLARAAHDLDEPNIATDARPPRARRPRTAAAPTPPTPSPSSKPTNAATKGEVREPPRRRGERLLPPQRGGRHVHPRRRRPVRPRASRRREGQTRRRRTSSPAGESSRAPLVEAEGERARLLAGVELSASAAPPGRGTVSAG